jgi:hypothetical protein
MRPEQYAQAGPPLPPKSPLRVVSKMQLCRSRQQQIQARELIVSNSRTHLDHIRFLCAMAPIKPSRQKSLSFNDSELPTQDPRNQASGQLYSLSPSRSRSRSMDDLLGQSPHPIDSTKLAKSSSMRRHLQKFLDQCRQKSHAPHFVGVHRRGYPSKHPSSPATRKQPRPRQGGFIEHIEENKRYQAMLGTNNHAGWTRVHGRTEAGEADSQSVGHYGVRKRVRFLLERAVPEGQQSAGERRVSGGRRGVRGRGRQRLAGGLQTPENGSAARRSTKYDCVRRWVRWILCLQSEPPRPRSRRGKTRVVRGILKKPQQEAE